MTISNTIRRNIYKLKRMSIWRKGAVAIIVLGILCELYAMQPQYTIFGARTYYPLGMAFFGIVFTFGFLLLGIWVKFKWHRAKWGI